MGKIQKAKQTGNVGFLYRCYAMVVVFLATLLIALIAIPLPIVHVARAVVSANPGSASDMYQYVSEKIDDHTLMNMGRSSGTFDASQSETNVDQSDETTAKLAELKRGLAVRVDASNTGILAQFQFRHRDKDAAVNFLAGLTEFLVASDLSTTREVSTDVSEGPSTSGTPQHTIISGLDVKMPATAMKKTVELGKTWIIPLFALAACLAVFVFVLLGVREKRFIDPERIEQDLKLPILGSVFPTRKKPKQRTVLRFIPKSVVRISEVALTAFVGFMIFCAVNDFRFLPNLIADPLSAYVLAFNQILG